MSSLRVICILTLTLLQACSGIDEPKETRLGPPPAPGAAGIEGLAADPFFQNVVAVSPGSGYIGQSLTGPTLLHGEKQCSFEGAFFGDGTLWLLASADGQWRAVERRLVLLEDSEQPLAVADPLDDWWAIAAVPEDRAPFVFQCSDGEAQTPAATEPHTTSEEDLAPTPESPRRWYPFRDWPGEEDYSAYENKDDLDLVGLLPRDCPTRVHSFDLYLTGQVRGNLSFNQFKRGGPSYARPMNGGNTTLGGFESFLIDRVVAWKSYKYQVEIRFLGPFQHAFFGQMMSDPQSFSFSDPEFHDDSPANDWVGKRWNLAPGEKKSDFPVIEIVVLTNTDHIVRYIDAPGGSHVMGYGVSDKYMYAIIYAGACGVVTHTKYLQL